jgi:hypothetical protein
MYQMSWGISYVVLAVCVFFIQYSIIVDSKLISKGLFFN